jgi:hypothetical protein
MFCIAPMDALRADFLRCIGAHCDRHIFSIAGPGLRKGKAQ